MIGYLKIFISIFGISLIKKLAGGAEIELIFCQRSCLIILLNVVKSSAYSNTNAIMSR